MEEGLDTLIFLFSDRYRLTELVGLGLVGDSILRKRLKY